MTDHPAGNEVFRLDGVTLRRDGRAILCGIDWTVRHGERWVVLGPNGSGKTSLVQILSTYLRTSEGTVTVFGRALARTSVHALRREMGYLSPALLTLIPERLTAAQIVDSAQVGALIPWYLDAGELSRERTNEALAAAGVRDLDDRRYGQMSSGEQLRVQLARALVSCPRALLLDEPTANLDIGGREALISSLATIAAGPMSAMVLIIHRLEDIPAGFTHGLLLRDGRIIAAGPLDEVLTDETLSAGFGVPLRVSRIDGRFSARGHEEPHSAASRSSRSIASR
ncbi:MAG TPA: ATP-binding cassette domain-containing protein [Methylomirabilota bacterium]|nr:ATP-binding cassette domain-containing protein [Methylomirabilota bacterium]